jgi:tetratricopeptide (TPR) repeat protein
MLLAILSAMAAPSAGFDLLKEAIALDRAGEKEAANTKLEDARKTLQEALTANPTADLHFELAQLHHWNGESEEAEKQAAATVALEPNHVAALSLISGNMARRNDHQGAVLLLRRIVAIDPGNLTSQYNLGVSAHLTGAYDLADSAFEKVYAADPKDWMALSKRVQIAQARGDETATNARIAELRRLAASGNAEKLAKRGFFTRDQFDVGDQHVTVFQYFELQGEHPVRYSFRLRKKGEDQGRISLGSYPATTQFMHELGTLDRTERAWHLDGYPTGGGHVTWGFFEAEPAYVDVKARVIAVLKGEITAPSSTMPVP